MTDEDESCAPHPDYATINWDAEPSDLQPYLDEVAATVQISAGAVDHWNAEPPSEKEMQYARAADYVHDLQWGDDDPSEDPATRLQAALSQPIRPFGESWQPEDDTDATWALRVMGRAKQEQDRIDDAAEEEIARVKAWQARAKVRPAATYAHFESLLIGYRIRCERDRSDFPATYTLPTGSMTRRAGSTRYEVTDSAAFAEWAIENDRAAVKVTPLISELKAKGSGYRPVDDLTAVKKTARKSPNGARTTIVSPEGELVPGVEVHVGPDSLKVTPE